MRSHAFDLNKDYKSSEATKKDLIELSKQPIKIIQLQPVGAT